jgi:ATP-dependent Clp protease protease subunit
MTQHIVHFHCQIDQSTSERFRDQCLAAVDQGASRLLLNMSTSGGSTNFGFTIYTFLKSLPVPLMAINAGNIESMGMVMFLAASERITSPHSRFLIHPMNWNFNQASVDHSRLREYLSSLNNDLDRYVKIFEQETEQAERKLDNFQVSVCRRKSNSRTGFDCLRHCPPGRASGLRCGRRTLEGQRRAPQLNRL